MNQSDTMDLLAHMERWHRQLERVAKPLAAMGMRKAAEQLEMVITDIGGVVLKLQRGDRSWTFSKGEPDGTEDD